MSYEKTEWKDGDIITAEKLNKLEDGVADGAVLQMVMIEESEHTIPDSSNVSIDAAPFEYHAMAKNIKNLLESGKRIVNIVAETSSDQAEIGEITFNNKNVIAHQFDDGFFDNSSAMFKVIWKRAYQRSGALTFTAKVYAVCI